jgi:hypothetical protein
MLTIIAVLVVLLLLGLNLYSGIRDGAFYAISACVRSLVAFLVAMTFCEPMAMLMKRYIAHTHPAYQYWRIIAFGFLLGLTVTIFRKLKVRFTPPEVPCHPVVDKSVGPVFGLLNGVMISGMILIMYTMVPAVKYLPNNHGDLGMAGRTADTGGRLLRFYSFVEKRFGGGATFLLDENEPMRPGLDLNNNGQPDLPDEDINSIVDLNGNGEWDEGWLVRYRDHARIEPIDMMRARGYTPYFTQQQASDE